MELYKVMLVDDEEEVREAMKRRINWEEIGFTVIATAENGEDAIEKAEIYEPDVVMTDIQMPFMDGLTMLKALKAIIPDIKSVIFSGFDEFEYAQEAIRLESEEYILKPIDAEELRRIFERIKLRLDEQADNRRNIEKLQQYYEQSLPMLKEQILIGLLEGRTSETDMKQYQEEYGIKLESAFYSVGVFAVDNPTNKETDKAIENKSDNNKMLNKSLAAVSLKQLVDERLEGRIDTYSINYLDTVVVLARLKSTAKQQDFISEMDRICKIAGRSLGLEVVAGIGRVYGNADAIVTSYLEAKDATHYRMFIDKNQALSISDVEPNVDIDAYVEEKQIRHLIREIKVGNEDSIKGEVRAFIERLKVKSISLGQLHLFYAEFLVELSRLARGHQINNTELTLFEINPKAELAGFSSLDNFGDRLIELSLNIHRRISSERMDTTKKLAEDAKQYIQDNYSRSNLSVDDICSHLGVGTSYFSSVFKKDTGMSFVSYLTLVRMNEAQRLLDTTDEKSYVIAGMVGYEEPNYFSYVFKKQFGVSPSKYRK